MEEKNNQDFISKSSPLSCFLCAMEISEIHRKEEIYLIDTKSPLQESTVNKVTPWSSIRWKPTP